MSGKSIKTPIEYDYPSLNRKDLMSHQPLNSNDFPIKKFNKLDTNRNWSVNLYNLDIERSSPRQVGSFHQKIDYTNKNDDIEKSNPKKLHFSLSKPHFNLSNEDIDCSSPNCVKIKTRRHLNPLEPKYCLPVSLPLAIEQPRFIRDSIQINDIDKTYPKKIMSRWFQRDTFKKDDIPNSSPKIPYKRRTFYDSINYEDATHCGFRSKRRTNPLEPVYHLEYPSGEKVIIGLIDGNKPAVFSKFNNPDPMNLKVNDISGSNPGSKNKINKFTGRNFMYSSNDIFGAQADSLKNGIVTKRNLNPLVPLYQFLGHEEMKDAAGYDPFCKSKPRTKSCTDIKEVIKMKGGENEARNKSHNNDDLPKGNEAEEKKRKELPIEEDKTQEIEALSCVQDNVEFDKEKFKMPNPFFGNIRDPYITPSDDEFKQRKHNDLTTKKASISKETGMPKGKTQELLTTLTIKNTAKLPDNLLKKQSYAQKLDDFMAKSNLQYVEK